MIGHRATVALVLWIAACAPAWAGEKTAAGTVQSVDAERRRVTIVPDSRGASPAEYDVSRKAVVTLDGKTAALDALNPGQRVTAHYDAALEVVTRLDATSAAPKGGRAADGGTIHVVASGTGKDEKEALHQAFANAVQQAVGVVVDAETVVNNDRVITD
jgi:hypothetical protein